MCRGTGRGVCVGGQCVSVLFTYYKLKGQGVCVCVCRGRERFVCRWTGRGLFVGGQREVHV